VCWTRARCVCVGPAPAACALGTARCLSAFMQRCVSPVVSCLCFVCACACVCVRVRVRARVRVLGMHVCVSAQGAVPSPGGSGRGPQAWPSASFSATGRPGSSSGSRPGTSAGGTRGSSGALRSSGATLVGG
jgi:hypothetical protein